MIDLKHVGSGKVRELWEAGDRLVLVATDRISAYDVVLPTEIPDKGRVLTALSHYFFGASESVCPNHFISVRAGDLEAVGAEGLAGRAMLCERAEPIPIEFVVRGYLAGSGWKDYGRTGSVCGHRLPSGLLESSRLPEPIVTPATKAVSGHDENISEQEAAAIAGEEVYETARSYALAIYDLGVRLAADRGVIIADTKFEFGLHDGRTILIDEVLTPDSSRFWPADSYAPGKPQPSFDKQYVRDWLDGSGWDHSEPGPELPSAVVDHTRRRYLEAYERITNSTLEAWVKVAAE